MNAPATEQHTLHPPQRTHSVHRYAFHLSLRTDDPFERSLIEGMRLLPHGSAKQFWVAMARMFLGGVRPAPEVRQIMYALATDRRPMAVHMDPALRVEAAPLVQQVQNGALAHLQVQPPVPGPPPTPQPLAREDTPVAAQAPVQHGFNGMAMDASQWGAG